MVWLKSLGDKLKNAISEPLASPDNNNSKIAREAANSTPVVGGMKLTSLSEAVNVEKSIMSEW